MRGHSTAPLQPDGREGPQTSASVPLQEVQLDAAESKVIADYDLDIDYEGSEPKIEPVTQEEKEENSNTEYANSHMMKPCNFMQRIQWAHR